MAEVVFGGENCGIQKKVLHAGKGNVASFVDGTKVKFHYIVRQCDEERTVVDDSKKDNHPLELLIGKKFKLEVWEKCIMTMRLDEVASFTVEPSLLGSYPMVAKSLRDIRKGKAVTQGHHCCGLTLNEQGLGYPDLDQFMKNPTKMEFIFELIIIEEPGQYEKEAWAMDEGEKLSAIPRLKESGNALYKEKKYEEAADKYAEALGMLENLLLKEKPHDDPWNELDQMKIPFLLNYSQCKLFTKDYYAVIEHTTEVLKREPENVKALFRRAKAHVGAWDPEEAKEDFKLVSKLDSSLAKTCAKEILNIEDLQKQKDQEDRNKLQGKMF